jgi:hypothetical protein
VKGKKKTLSYRQLPWKRIQYNQIDLQLTTIPNGSSTERFQTEISELLDKKYKEHTKVNTDGFRKDRRVVCAIVTPKCKREKECKSKHNTQR